MSEESLFMTDNSGNNNANANANNNNNTNKGNNSNQYPSDFMNATTELEQYDLGDPFNTVTNIEEQFAGNFLDTQTNQDDQNFSLDPTSIANEFSTHLLPSYNPLANDDPHFRHSSQNPFEAAAATTSAASQRDSPFDVNQFSLHDHHSVNTDNLSNGHISNDDNNQNSNGEEQEDSQAPKRSRATGEALALLISEFSKNINPNGAVRKQLADATGMSERSVRIWFQNRRAKAKKMEKMHKDGDASHRREYANSFSGTDSRNLNEVALVTGRNSMSNLQQQTKAPININENYCLVDCNSISIGTWQRIKSGYINSQILKNLINLSPKFLNSLMFTTDLLIILSKKNKELNYFFSGFFQNNKILFRIFYPLENILSCSLLNQQQAIGDSKTETTTIEGAELRLTLSSSPKFAVFFLNNTTTGRENTNQWSICDDFSEGQQVNNAFVGEGGSDTPHILSGGDHDALQFLNNYILQYHQQQAAAAAAHAVQSNQAPPSDLLGGDQDEISPDAVGGMSSAPNPDDFLLEGLGGVGDISGGDNLLGF